MSGTTNYPVKYLLTHESPDIDAITSVLLMRRYGEELFPGANSAELIFCPADKLPGNKTTQELEKEGVLALDIGGGRFDTHPVNNKVSSLKKDRSATDLVAEELGVNNLPEWQPFVEFVRLQDTLGHSLFSKDHIHNLVSLTTIVQGIDFLYPDDSAKKMEIGSSIIENIPAYIKNNLSLPVDNNNVFATELDLIKKMLDNYLSNKNISFGSSKEYENILKWSERLNSDPIMAFSKIKIDFALNISAITNGAYYKSDSDFDYAYNVFELCLDAILVREKKWADALVEFNSKAVIKKVDKIDIVSIESENGMVIKIARFLTHGDIIIFRNPIDGSTTLFIKRNGILRNFPFKKIVSKIRLVESYLNKENPLFDRIDDFGEINGWFLHQGDCLLIKGSPKAKDFIPSKIDMKLLREIVYYVFDSNNEFDIPKEYFKLFLANDIPNFRKSYKR